MVQERESGRDSDRGTKTREQEAREKQKQKSWVAWGACQSGKTCGTRVATRRTSSCYAHVSSRVTLRMQWNVRLPEGGLAEVAAERGAQSEHYGIVEGDHIEGVSVNLVRRPEGVDGGEELAHDVVDTVAPDVARGVTRAQ